LENGRCWIVGGWGDHVMHKLILGKVFIIESNVKEQGGGRILILLLFLGRTGLMYFLSVTSS
jgi:hypothetical protein